MRIVSLLASGTEIAFALGLGDAVVGISHECDHPPAALNRPRVSRPRFDPTGLSSADIDAAVREAHARYGSVYELDTGLLEQLAPDLVLAQAVCEVCAVPTSLAADTMGALGQGARLLSLDAHSIDEVLDSVRQVGEASGAQEPARRIVAGARARIEAVRTLAADAPPVSVLAIEWLAPPFLPGHWMPEMVTVAGGKMLGASPHAPSRQVVWDELLGLDPDVVVVMPCGYDLVTSRREADIHADRLLRVAPRAVDAGRTWVVDGSAYFNRSGPRTVDGVELLGAMLHPERFPNVPLDGRATLWSPPV